MKKYDLVIFDLDGTLLDTSEGILKSVRYTIDRYGLPMPSEEILRTFIGPPIQDSFRKEYGLSEGKAMEMANVFRERYKNEDLLLADYYPQIMESLKKLKDAGCKLAVATNKREDYAIDILRHFGMLDLMDAAYGTDFEGKLKKPDVINKCIETTGIRDKTKAIMVGDTKGDQKSAKKAGTHFLAVTYGFGYRPGEMIENCAGVADDASGIVQACVKRSPEGSREKE